MKELEKLKLKFGYLPDLAKADFKGHLDFSMKDVFVLAAGQPNTKELVSKAKLYFDLRKERSSGNSATIFNEQTHGQKDLFEDVTFVNEFAFLTDDLTKELSVYTNIIRISTTKPPHASVSALAAKSHSLLSGRLSDEQLDFVSSCFNRRVSILSGGPGMGKTHTNKCLVNFIIDHGVFNRDEIAVLGSTNKCLASYSDLRVDVLTAHKALGFNPFRGDFIKSLSNKLKYKFIIVEESSMLDLSSIACLLSAIDDDAHLVLCGDKDQFGCVGVGDVFFDLCSLDFGDLINKVSLTKNYRSNSELSLFLEFLRGDKSVAPASLSSVNIVHAPKVAESYYEKLLKVLLKFQSSGLSMLTDLQILSPTYAGMGGITKINELIHKAITEDNFSIDIGDKISIGKPSGEFTQGEQLIVSEVSKGGNSFGVMKKGIMMYTRQSNMPTLSHCLSIHEAQGSEWNNGLILLDKESIKWLGFRGVNTAASRFRNSLTFYGDIAFSDFLDLDTTPRSTLASAFGYNMKSLLTFLRSHLI